MQAYDIFRSYIYKSIYDTTFLTPRSSYQPGAFSYPFIKLKDL